MGESIGIDSLLGGWAMPKAYSGEMRERVIAEVESGASRREAAEEFAVSASTAVIWVKCFRQTGPCLRMTVISVSLAATRSLTRTNLYITTLSADGTRHHTAAKARANNSKLAARKQLQLGCRASTSRA